MKKTRNLFKSYLILSIIFISLISIFTLTPFLNYEGEKTDITHIENQYDNYDLKSADNGRKPLNYSSIFQNVTSLHRLFESIYFSVNTSGFSNVNYTIMQIYYPNESSKNFSMSELNEDEFEYIYTPSYDAVLGFHQVNFYLFNQTDYLLNTHTTFINFTITSNYIGKIDNPEYERLELVEGEFKIFDYDSHTFTWELSVVNNLNESLEDTLFTLGTENEYFVFELNESFSISNRIYYVKIKVTDTFSSKISRIYLPFKLLNSIPEIIVDTINFSSDIIKRDEECTVTLNITDGDRGIDTFAENMSVIITIQDSRGIKTTPTPMTNKGDWTFEYTFSIAISKPIGRYQVIFDVFDQFIEASESHIEIINVENNIPKIHGFTINDINVENSIAINYGEDIRFKFNLTDVENGISFITVHLLNERNEWYNVSIAYSNNVELIIRTIDLISGSWYVYLTVYDRDGGTATLTTDYDFAPKEIRIIPDVLSPILPWVSLITGLILGFLGALAFTYPYLKSKYSKAVETTPKKKKMKRQKVKQQPEKQEKKPQGSEKEEESEKEPSESKPIQRKIKRRLK